MPVTLGSIQICRKCVVCPLAWLNSLCVTPVPALIRWTSPGGMPLTLPMLSLCASSPEST
jgi:hypothetical protein